MTVQGWETRRVMISSEGMMHCTAYLRSKGIGDLPLLGASSYLKILVIVLPRAHIEVVKGGVRVC